jgi:Zn-dependent peptidase ImmA (M78 family)
MNRSKATAFLEQVVSYLLVRAGCLTLPINLEKVSKYLNVSEIKTVDMAAEAFVEQKDDGSFLVGLRTDRSAQRSRFSFAHELAHIVMHKLNESEGGSLGRQYRRFNAIESDSSVEATADLAAGILLVPPHAISELLPSSFSLRRIVALAERADCSIPTAMIRAGWYATQPLVLFHARRYRARRSSTKFMWTSTSRSLESLSKSKIANLLSEGHVAEAISSTSLGFVTTQDDRSVISRCEVYRNAYFDRETIYGIGYVRPEIAQSLLFVDHEGTDQTEGSF